VKYFIFKDCALTKLVRPVFTLPNLGKTKSNHRNRAKVMLKKEYQRLADGFGCIYSDYDIASLQVTEVSKKTYEDYIEDTKSIVSKYFTRKARQQLEMEVGRILPSLSDDELLAILKRIKKCLEMQK